MAATNPARVPKGILKKPSDAASEQRDLAVQHASILQHRKDLEAQILEDVILLSEYPLVTSPPHDASNPALTDVKDFRSRVRLFQPSDYDDLIEERNVNGLCGYTLCSRPRRDAGRGGQWTFSASGQIVKRKEIEKWCSQRCARRALYVKVQLNETAAWERAGIPDIEIDLLPEQGASETDEDKVARKLAGLKLEDQRQAARDSAALARERGETPKASGSTAVKVTLREKEETKPPESSDMDVSCGDDDHLMVEGYKSKRGDPSAS